jgi:hypothetical protein
MLPAMCLARVAISSRDPVARVCLFVAITLSLVSYNVGVFTLLNRITLYLGFVTLTTLSLLVGCWWCRMEEPALKTNN